MERNYNILTLLFASWFLCNCEYKEFPDDLPDYYIPLKKLQVSMCIFHIKILNMG